MLICSLFRFADARGKNPCPETCVIAHADSFYLPYTICLKQDVNYMGAHLRRLFSFLLILLVLIFYFPFLISGSLHLSLTHFFLVIDSKELCSSSHLGFVYFF